MMAGFISGVTWPYQLSWFIYIYMYIYIYICIYIYIYIQCTLDIRDTFIREIRL